MKIKIRLTKCNCGQPIAAVYAGPDTMAACLPIKDQIVDLSAIPLIWCPNCSEVLTDIAMEDAPCA